jgi:biopolymer transport protein ExbB/TolQ|tara:strand:+ start:569 stop:829 length:261 start_codon:yes stop_codon:yes gene_type:complete
MPAKIFDADSTAKLKRLIEEGMQVKQEVSDLNAGLRETVKALSEELEIKPAMLNKAISVAFKAGLHDEQTKLEELETILATVGKTA